MIETVVSVLIGVAAMYAPGVMDRVADNRGLPRETCMVAMAQPIGTRVAVYGDVGAAECVVMDVPHPRDRSAIAARGIVVELDYRSSWRVCRNPLLGPAQCPVVVVVSPRPVVRDVAEHE